MHLSRVLAHRRALTITIESAHHASVTSLGTSRECTLKLTDETEKEQLNTLYDEILQAIALEPEVRLQDLDIAAWQKKLNVPDAIVQDMLKKDKKRFEG